MASGSHQSQHLRGTTATLPEGVTTTRPEGDTGGGQDGRDEHPRRRDTGWDGAEVLEGGTGGQGPFWGNPEAYVRIGWHRILKEEAQPPEDSDRPLVGTVRSGDYLRGMSFGAIADLASVAQRAVWWRSAFVAPSLGSADLSRALQRSIVRSPQPLLRKAIPHADCFLQLEQQGGAIARTNASTWAHRDASALISWICMWPAPGQGRARLAGTSRLLPGVDALIESWMADGVASLGQHARGAYQGYASRHDSPEALYGSEALGRLRSLQSEIDGASEVFGPGAGLEPLERVGGLPPEVPSRGETAHGMQYVLVTGGTGAIGLATARALAEALPGAQVLLASQNASHCELVSRGTPLACLAPLDLANAPEAAARALGAALSAALQLGVGGGGDV